jgi:hypothetical protein
MWLIIKLPFLFLSTPPCSHHTYPLAPIMAPSLEEPTQVDFDAPLKAAPKLVAPEPGMWPRHPSALLQLPDCARRVSVADYSLHRTLSWPRIATGRASRQLRRLPQPSNMCLRTERPRPRHSPHNRAPLLRKAQDPRSER